MLRNDGLHVREETSIDRIKSTVDGATLDVVAMGRTIKSGKREDLVMSLRAQNPDIKVVDGLAPIVPLVVAQVREALVPAGPGGRIVADAAYEEANNRVVLITNRRADVGVTLHRLDSLHRAHEVPVYVGPLGRGTHNLPLFRPFGRGERFIVVDADAETTTRALS